VRADFPQGRVARTSSDASPATAPRLAEHLAAACPTGIDVHFENVGGAVFDAVLPLLNNHARASLRRDRAPQRQDAAVGPEPATAGRSTVPQRRIGMQGLIILDRCADRFDTFRREWANESRAKVKLREDRVAGLENAPAAVIGLLGGRNFGRLVVRVADA
jgi:NADPH-dependent curcumin reductase CurA